MDNTSGAQYQPLSVNQADPSNPPPMYAPPPMQYGQPPAQYGQPPAQYGQPPMQYAPPPQQVVYAQPMGGHHDPHHNPHHHVDVHHAPPTVVHVVQSHGGCPVCKSPNMVHGSECTGWTAIVCLCFWPGLCCDCAWGHKMTCMNCGHSVHIE